LEPRHAEGGGVMDRPLPATGQMPFGGHRTCKEVREHMEQLDRAAGRMAAVFAGEPKAVRA
jgi:hypothetical protein